MFSSVSILYFPYIKYNLKHDVMQQMAYPSATPTPLTLKIPMPQKRERRPLSERATYFQSATSSSFISHNRLHSPSSFPTKAALHPLRRNPLCAVCSSPQFPHCPLSCCRELHSSRDVPTYNGKMPSTDPTLL